MNYMTTVEADSEVLENELDNRYRVTISFNITAETIDDVQELVRELLPLGDTGKLEFENVEPAEVD